MECIYDYHANEIKKARMKMQEKFEVVDTKQREEDRAFLIDVIFKIRDYANERDMEPDDTIRGIAENMLAILQIATFNGGDENENCD